MVRLDDRPIRTPGGQRLTLPSRESAEAIAAEWRAQPARIDVAAMPLTRLASTALDRVAANMPAVIDILLGYAGAELLVTGPKRRRIWSNASRRSGNLCSTGRRNAGTRVLRSRAASSPSPSPRPRWRRCAGRWRPPTHGG